MMNSSWYAVRKRDVPDLQSRKVSGNSFLASVICGADVFKLLNVPLHTPSISREFHYDLHKDDPYSLVFLARVA
jgi:hypothetical protein